LAAKLDPTKVNSLWLKMAPPRAIDPGKTATEFPAKLDPAMRAGAFKKSAPPPPSVDHEMTPRMAFPKKRLSFTASSEAQKTAPPRAEPS
jgi:hypothetical protein